MHGIEEGLLRDVEHPSHRDRAPEVAGAVIAVSLLGVWAAVSLDLGAVATAMLAALGVLSGLAAGEWLRRSRAARNTAVDCAERAARRANADRETARQIADARARGAFARWDAR